MSDDDPFEEGQRLNLCVRGAVQGVGFRPFIYRLAGELGLAGWVRNDPGGVEIEVEGPHPQLQAFLLRLGEDVPPPGRIHGIEPRWLDPAGLSGFHIRSSGQAGPLRALVLPDIATCDACLAELFDPSNRRYRYPFINCTHCGPRYSIIERMPYDRAGTTMRAFPLCPDCRAEYENPADRRFHAQPNACPRCGPALFACGADGTRLAERTEALTEAIARLREGAIVAVKGLGGFHLMVDARDADAVRRLRERKQREEKPFAVMCPSLEMAAALAETDALEARLLQSPEAPIVLVRARPGIAVAPNVAPGNPWLGLMLPYTPVHHLLLHAVDAPLVATSGNLSDEPLCTGNEEAVQRLSGIADLFLLHNRPIARPVDDSIVRVLAGREQLLRRARGYAPLPLAAPTAPQPLLAVGGHLKNTIALAEGDRIIVSPHIGDLDTDAARRHFEHTLADFQQLFALHPNRVAADLHPDYASTRWARASGLPVTGVQHHHAHIAACMAENGLDGEVLGVAWDGTGYGTDGTVWGGEFLRATRGAFTRVAHLRSFRLPGGEQAVKEPRRCALGLLHAWRAAALDDERFPPVRAFTPKERSVLARMLERGLNAPETSSAGRLFDAVASLADLRQRTRYEGQAAMELEFALVCPEKESAYPMPLAEGVPAILDWGPMIEALWADVCRGAGSAAVSARFHNALAEGVVAVARRTGLPNVALSGGCFLNRYLAERCIARLREEGFKPYWHQRLPPGDGGIAAGQAVVAAARL